MKHAFSSLNKVSIDDQLKIHLILIDSILRHYLTEKLKKVGHFFTLGGESVDLDKLSTSLFVYLLLIV